MNMVPAGSPGADPTVKPDPGKDPSDNGQDPEDVEDDDDAA
jgi:hypothetical protein